MSKYLYGISKSYSGMYAPSDALTNNLEKLDKKLVEDGYVFVAEDEGGFEYEKDGDYKKIFKYWVEEMED